MKKGGPVARPVSSRGPAPSRGRAAGPRPRAARAASRPAGPSLAARTRSPGSKQKTIIIKKKSDEFKKKKFKKVMNIKKKNTGDKSNFFKSERVVGS